MFSSVFSNMIEGVIILAILCGIYGLSNDVLSLAGMAQKWTIKIFLKRQRALIIKMVSN